MKATAKKDHPIKRLYAVLRWDYEKETTGHSFRLNNPLGTTRPKP
jgi:hypothetical protein